jgi:ribonuclease P protein component
MLPAVHRLRRSKDFAAVLRGGRRAGGGRLLVVHSLRVSQDGTGVPRRFGLVVSKSVGNSVVRHRVSRRLRALLALRMDTFPPASDVVVRALAPAGGATSSELGAGLDRALVQLGALGARGVPSGPVSRRGGGR